jgi:RNA polymerase sigma factor (sigma-70 family)
MLDTTTPALARARRSGALETSQHEDLHSVIRAASSGDEWAWQTIVDRFGAAVRGVARAIVRNPADTEDVVQTTWLRLMSHLDRLNQPAALGAWLCITARREALRVLRGRAREHPADALELSDSRLPSPEHELLQAERTIALQRALETLPTRHRALLRMLLRDPVPSYEEISAALDMPVGSIGPTRGRCLARLRGHERLAGFASYE